MKNKLEQLFNLTIIEQERKLTEGEIVVYTMLVKELREGDIDIPFGIEE
jgi:hypothetical protein